MVIFPYTFLHLHPGMTKIKNKQQNPNIADDGEQAQLSSTVGGV